MTTFVNNANYKLDTHTIDDRSPVLEAYVRKLATAKNRQIDKVVLDNLKPWQRYVVKKKWTRFRLIREIIRRTSGITIEHQRPLTTIKQRGKILARF